MSDLRTHPPDHVLDDFLLGKLSDADHTWVEEHLAECPECLARAAVSRTDTLTELLAATVRTAATGVTPDPSADLTPSVLAPTLGWDPGAAAEDDQPAGLVGHPKYRVVRRLGAGGMGTVWLAEHAVMNRPVAVKVIRPDLLARPGAADRFLREVRAAAKLHHPNIVTAYDAEPAGDSCLLVMEYVEGETLAERVKAGPLPAAEACRAVRDAARGLAHAHAAGLVHRDVKPHNLIRAADGTVKVLDFGLAGVGAGDGAARGGDGLTGAGMVAGTPDYIAPEQAADPHAADARADIYGLGCTLYHLLAGRPPFPAGSVVEKLRAHETRMPDPIPDLPPGLAEVLAKMLAKRPEDRYQTAEELLAALEPFSGVGRGPRGAERGFAALRSALRSPRFRVVVGLLFAALAVAGAVVYKIQRDNQEIVVQTDDPDIEVVMKRKGEVIRVIDRKSGQTWEIDTAANQIGLADQPDGLTLPLPENEAVVMRRQGKEVFSITRVTKPEEFCEVRRFDDEEKDCVWSVSFSPDGKRVLKGGGTHVVLYDRRTGKTAVSIRHGCWSAALSPDGKQILTATAGATVHLWDAATGEQIQLNVPELGRVRNAVFSPDGKLAAASHSDNFVHLWDLATGKDTQQFPAFHQAVHSAAFTPDGKKILVIDDPDNKTLILYDVKTGEKVRTFEGHTEPVYDVAVSADGRRALSGGTDKIVRLWDLTNGKELLRLEGHTDGIHAVAFCPGGRRAISGGLDKVVRLWDLETGKEVRSFEGHADHVVTVAVSRDGRYAASGSAGDKTVRLWQLPDAPAPEKPGGPPEKDGAAPQAVGDVPEKPGEVRRFEGHKGWVARVAFSPDGRLAISTCPAQGDRVRVWEVASGKQVGMFDRVQGGWGLDVPSDGKRVLCSDRTVVYLLDLTTEREVRPLKGHTAGVWAAVFLPDGKRAVTGGADCTLRLWDLETGRELKQFEGVKEGVRCLALSPDGRTLAAGHFLNPDAGAGVLRLWDVETGKEVRDPIKVPNVIHAVAFAADGQHVLTGDRGGVVRLWDLGTGEEARRFEGHKGPVEAVAFTPDGRVVSAGGTGDGTLRVWDAKTGKQLDVFAGPRDGLLGLAVAPDGRHVLTGAKDRVVRLWRLPDPPAAKP
jgi:WD40 repeat protein